MSYEYKRVSNEEVPCMPQLPCRPERRVSDSDQVARFNAASNPWVESYGEAMLQDGDRVVSRRRW